MRLLLLVIGAVSLVDAGFLDFLKNIAHGSSSSSSSNIRTPGNRGSVSDDDAKKYLNNFGYVNVGNSLNAAPGGRGFSADLSSARDILKSAILKFQDFAGLRRTGELDDQTKQKMAQPRCGMMDVLAVTDGGAAFKWKKTSLTYSIENFSSDLPRDQVRRAISEAYAKWAAVTPLEFREVSSGGDIKIRFGVRDHGDPWSFDGQGGVLAHATMPESGILHFDDDENWAYRDANKIGNDYTDLLAVAIHEGGHAIGLSHSRNEKAIMAPFYQSTVDRNGNYNEPQLTQDDIQAIQDIYGRGSGGSSSWGGGGSSWNGGGSSGGWGTTQRPTTTTKSSHWWDRIFGNDDQTTTSRPWSGGGSGGSSGGSSWGSGGSGGGSSGGSGGSSWGSGSSGFGGSSGSSGSDCPTRLDAFTKADNGNSYLFQGTKVYELVNRRVSKVYSLRQLFPSSPSFVQAVVYDPNSGLTLLFSSGQVYGYYYSRLRGGFTLDAEYPKRLPSIGFTPQGALRWIDGQQILLSSGNEFAVYDEYWNQSTLQGRISSYYPNLPSGVKGAVVTGSSVMTVFTSTQVFDYDIRSKSINDQVRLGDWVQC